MAFFVMVIEFFSAYPRAVGRSENPGKSVLFAGHNLPTLVEIGLTDCQNLGVP